MKRSCATCNGSMKGKRANAKYCSDACRFRGAKRGGTVSPAATVTEIPAAPPSESRRPPLGATATMVLAELEAADRVQTVAGVAALQLALEVDRGSAGAQSGYASLVRQLHATMAIAMAGAKIADDIVDELKERRAARLRGA